MLNGGTASGLELWTPALLLSREHYRKSY